MKHIKKYSKCLGIVNKSALYYVPIIFIVALSLNSCATYLIPVESFKQQFTGIDSSSLREVTVIGPTGMIYNYPANPIKTIYCVDKEGQQHELENKPSIEIRVTYGDKNRKNVFYFDRIFVSDSLMYGVASRFIPSIRKTIPLKEITKIEVQDGKKNFRYKND
jgi:hypothetical protein